MKVDFNSEINWEESANEGLPTLGWPLGMCMGGVVLTKLMTMGRPSPLWEAPFPGRVEKPSRAETKQKACVLSPLDCGYDVTSCLEFLPL